MRVFLLILLLAGLIGAGLYFAADGIYQDYESQQEFQRIFGKEWKEHYEQKFGPGSVEWPRTKIIAGCVGVPVIVILFWLFYRQVERGRAGGSGYRQHKKIRQKYDW